MEEDLPNLRLLEGLWEESHREEGKGPFTTLRVPSTKFAPLNDNTPIDVFVKVVEDQLRLLDRSRPSGFNTTQDEMVALRSLKGDDTIIIKPSDKGGNVVVMDRTRYSMMCYQILNDHQCYKVLESDPSMSFRNQLKCILSSAKCLSLISEKEMAFMLPDFPQTATFYCLPKIHKGTKPLKGRPIVSGIDSLSQNASIYIDQILRPFVVSLPSYVRDTMDVLRKLEGIRCDQDVLLASLDVEALYSSIPHDQGCVAVEYFLKSKGTQFQTHNEFVINDNKITFLDILISKTPSGNIQTNMFRKKTATNSLLRWENCHPVNLKRGIPKGQFLRARRNCSTISDYKMSARELEDRFRRRGYPKHVLKQAYQNALGCNRNDLLNPKSRLKDDDTIRIIGTYDSASKEVREILQRYWGILQADPDVGNLDIVMEGFPAVFYSEPAVLGLLANAVSAFLVCMQNFTLFNTSVSPGGVENILAGVHLILIGGVSQLIAGFLSFRKYDHLSGTAFLAFSALWSSYGATRIIVGSESNLQNSSSIDTLTQIPVNEGAVAGLVAYILIAFILAFCSATVNYIMPFVFGALTLTLIFEAVGLFGRWALVVSGVLELIIVLCGLYGAGALLLKGISQRYVLPGFGNSLFNVLLLGSANRNSSKTAGEEKKKNTKYAEPMALGYLCDTISPFIMAFYCFGYIKNFYVGCIWISINVLSQLCSSYYCYLRDDVYYATKFAFHGTFWLVKSWEEFTISVVLTSENITKSRESMVGDWFFLAISCLFCFLSLNKDLLEVIHSTAFAVVTVSTIQQIPSTAGYIFFGVTCGIFTAVSLYTTFASLVNSIAEKVLIPIGNMVISKAKFQDIFLWGRKCLMRQGEDLDIKENLSSRPSDPLFYICNGLAALAAIQSSLDNTVQAHLSIPWVLIPGSVMQLYVSRMDVQGGRRFGSVLPFCFSAIWATWVWLRFAGTIWNITLCF
ncbi:uncharacterized protein LOC142652437 [Rhinoderma darwinii]|uniref:uncharacterized protein LOC142652437 n=1 Tax=Rhinoderma darwinii TaxID=43563 RepID=UPI003F67A3BE